MCGCLNTLVGTDNLLTRARAAAKGRKKFGKLDELIDAALAGDPIATSTLEYAGRQLGLGLASQVPELDGFEATRALRAWERQHGRPHLPVIAMTANAMAQDREQCLAAGMDDFVSKPVSAKALAEAVERLVAAHARREVA